MIDNNRKNPLYKGAEKCWFALYTKPRSEFKAADQLTEIGVDFYLPTITKVKQWSDRKKKVKEPVLSGYILIFATEIERIASLEQFSIVRCVTEKGKPAKIPEWQVENFKRMLDTGSDFHIIDGLVPGAKVRIKDGPFEGVMGTYQESENERSIAVSIELLNRTVVTHLPKESNIEVLK